MAKAKILPEIAEVEDLGGVKINAYPVEDPDTDLDSGAWNETMGNVAALTRTAPRAIVVIEFAGVAGYESIYMFDSVWGSAIEPTITRTGLGEFTLLFESSVSDLLIESGNERYSEYEEHDLAIRAATGSTNKTYLLACDVVAGNEIYLSTSSAGGSLADPVAATKVTIVVY